MEHQCKLMRKDNCICNMTQDKNEEQQLKNYSKIFLAIKIYLGTENNEYINKFQVHTFVLFKHRPDHLYRLRNVLLTRPILKDIRHKYLK